MPHWHGSWQLDQTSDSHGERPYLDLAVGELVDWLHDQRRDGGIDRAAWEAHIEVTRRRYLTGVGWAPWKPATGREADLMDDVDEAAAIAWRRVTGRRPWTGNGRQLIAWADEHNRAVARLATRKATG